MLINWRSASDSEVTPLGFRDLGLGRIVGNPTNASVIATGSYGLINGGSIRTPGSLVVAYDPIKAQQLRRSTWKTTALRPTSSSRTRLRTSVAGFDRELDAAIKEVLRMLGEGIWQYRR